MEATLTKFRASTSQYGRTHAEMHKFRGDFHFVSFCFISWFTSTRAHCSDWGGQPTSNAFLHLTNLGVHNGSWLAKKVLNVLIIPYWSTWLTMIHGYEKACWSFGVIFHQLLRSMLIAWLTLWLVLWARLTSTKKGRVWWSMYTSRVPLEWN